MSTLVLLAVSLGETALHAALLGAPSGALDWGASFGAFVAVCVAAARFAPHINPLEQIPRRAE